MNDFVSRNDIKRRQDEERGHSRDSSSVSRRSGSDSRSNNRRAKIHETLIKSRELLSQSTNHPQERYHQGARRGYEDSIANISCSLIDLPMTSYSRYGNDKTTRERTGTSGDQERRRRKGGGDVNEKRRKGRSTTHQQEEMNGHYNKDEERSQKSAPSPSYIQRNRNNQLESNNKKRQKKESGRNDNLDRMRKRDSSSYQTSLLVTDKSGYQNDLKMFSNEYEDNILDDEEGDEEKDEMVSNQNEIHQKQQHGQIPPREYPKKKNDNQDQLDERRRRRTSTRRRRRNR